jgi:uncharacterized protein YpmS
MAISKEPFEIKLNTGVSISSMSKLKETLGKESKYLFSEKSSRDRKIIFTSEEINTAFNIYLSAYQLNSMFGKKKSENKAELRGGMFKKGKLVLYLSQKFPFENPMGRYLNIRIELIPLIKDNKLKLEVISLAVGSVPIPAFAIDYILKNKEPSINNMKEVRLLLSAVKSFEVNEDTVTIIYNPAKLALLASEFSGKYDF